MSRDTYIAQHADSAPPPFKGEAFEALQREWYARLAASGFEDAEVKSQSGWDGRLPREYYRGMAREQYFRLAGWWEHDRVWPNRRLKRAWQLHANGERYRNIPAQLGPVSPAHDHRRIARSIKLEARRMATHYTKAGTQ